MPQRPLLHSKAELCGAAEASALLKLRAGSFANDPSLGRMCGVMKSPVSPAYFTESFPAIPLYENGQPESTCMDLQAKREKRLPSFTLCEVCNIQLNSAAQAQIHYNGKSHQKRLKQINKGKNTADWKKKSLYFPLERRRDGETGGGAPTHGSPLLASLGIPNRPIQTHLDIKHLLTFRINGVSPLSLFPNFNAMDPVQKAVINHTFGGPSHPKRKPFISCNVCHLRFNSLNQAEAHYKGHKHARKLRALESARHKHKQNGKQERAPAPPVDAKRSADSQTENAQPEITRLTELDTEPICCTPTSEPQNTDQEEACASPETSDTSAEIMDTSSPAPEEPYSPEKGSEDSCASTQDNEKKRKNREHLYCATCKVTVNSTSQLEAHNAGAKHKSILEGQSTHPRRSRGKALGRATRKPKRIGNKTSIGIQNKAFNCPVCEIHVNSETQLKQHMNSRRHKDRLAGKPPKPKYSPFSKLQKNAALATRLALHKHLTKTLAARFLPSPLTPTAVCTLPGPLALRPATAAALFQTPFLGPALFRSPPPAIRPSPTPIMFAPY
ncbi:zinc finger protein 385C isoform X3 [Hyperolius riggenbachi]|uniref:zinc finger protein 385C isoform X3 n=1 Tax=Hyperolius riggenbachi TaxID=752182 RepID=UPI0035A387C8